MARKETRNAQGGGNIRQRPNGLWEARYTVGRDPGTGKQIQKSVYGKTQKEVRQKLSKATSEIDEGTYFEPSKMTLGQWLDIWLDSYVAHSVKPYTLDSYRTQAEKHIKPAIGKVRLAALTAPLVQGFYNDLLEVDGLSPKSIKNIHGVLHKALSQAVKVGNIRYNPADACDLPKARKKEIVPLEREEISNPSFRAKKFPCIRFEYRDFFLLFNRFQAEKLNLPIAQVAFTPTFTPTRIYYPFAASPS